MAGSSRAELFSGAAVAILHVPANHAGLLNVPRYLPVIRLAAPYSPVAAGAASEQPSKPLSVPCPAST